MRQFAAVFMMQFYDPSKGDIGDEVLTVLSGS